MKTLEEAIIYCKRQTDYFKEKAEEYRAIGEHISSPLQPYNLPVKEYRGYADFYEQLVKWLKELRDMKGDTDADCD